MSAAPQCIDRRPARAVWRLDQVIDTVRQRHGRDISVFDEGFLVQALDGRLAAAALPSTSDYVERLAANPAEATALCDSLDVTYSEFFRNRVSFGLLEHVILPRLVEQKAHQGAAEIRAWSAACAEGQEAYSLAMLLDELLETDPRAVPYRIFGTDRSEPALALAREATYAYPAVQNVALRHIRGRFTQHGESFRVSPRLRERVSFSTHDLLAGSSASPSASIYGDFDVVMCCNVLFYYGPTARRTILDRVHRSMSSGAYLVTGEAECQLVAGHGGYRRTMDAATIFQKVGPVLPGRRCT